MTQRYISKETVIVEKIKCWLFTAINYKKN